MDDFQNIETKVTEYYTIFEYKYDKIIQEEVKNYDALLQEARSKLGPVGKPLKHRFIANKLKQRIESGKASMEIIPPTILEIVKKIMKVTYFGSILQSA
ncbi:MAG: hypothetical protein ACXADY_16800 [Candidatus Hodarchaeales archaeon]|jgi:hypothetical protein